MANARRKKILKRRNPVSTALLTEKNKAVQAYHDAMGLLKPMSPSALQKLALKAAHLEGKVVKGILEEAQEKLENAVTNLVSQATLLCAGGKVKEGLETFQTARRFTKNKSMQKWIDNYTKGKTGNRKNPLLSWLLGPSKEDIAKGKQVAEEMKAFDNAVAERKRTELTAKLVDLKPKAEILRSQLREEFKKGETVISDLNKYRALAEMDQQIAAIENTLEGRSNSAVSFGALRRKSYERNSESLLHEIRSIITKLFKQNESESNIKRWIELHQKISDTLGHTIINDFEMWRPTRKKRKK